MISAKRRLFSKVAGQSNILPIWQPVGHSTYQITNLVAQKFGKKATHTGVLDPLAEGVIIVLVGDERFKKMAHTSWLKEYEFEITFGVATDSFDGMGVTTHAAFDATVQRAQLEEALQSLVGPYAQKVPLYSARKVAGKRLYLYPKHGQPIPELPVKSGRIHSIELLDFGEAHLHTKINESIEKVKNIQKGEFRQTEIIAGWEEFLQKMPNQVVETAKIKVVLTRGLYVRSLAQDIAEKVGKHGFVSQLIRTKNGLYTKNDCTTLESLFGKYKNPGFFLRA